MKVLFTLRKLTNLILLDDLNRFETAVKAVLIQEGVERCVVGFVPRSLLRYADALHKKFVQVTELYASSSLKSERARSHRNGGMALCVLLEDESIQSFEDSEVERQT